MSSPFPRRTAAAISAAALLVATALGAGTATAGGNHHHGFGDDTPKVVADQLDNPRGLAAAPGGSLLVALSGSGGPTCEGEGEEAACIGDTSGIDKIRAPFAHHPQVSTVLGGQPSIAGPDGSFAGGISGVSANGFGNVYGVGAVPPELGDPTGGLAGKLFRVKHGNAVVVADISAYEEANDPDGQGVESNPYGVLAQNRRVLVADAAANTVVSVNRQGVVSTFHVFPNIQTGPCAGQENDEGTTGCDFVPTSLAAGPRGTIYVTGLASEAPGEGRVVKLSKHGNVLKEWSGFSSPVGVAVRSNGTFYVSELFANADFENPDPPNIGLVTKVRGGDRESRVIPLPAGIVIVGAKLYVSVYSVAPGSGLFGNPDWNGQIWRMNL